MLDRTLHIIILTRKAKRPQNSGSGTGLIGRTNTSARDTGHLNKILCVRRKGGIKAFEAIRMLSHSKSWISNAEGTVYDISRYLKL